MMGAFQVIYDQLGWFYLAYPVSLKMEKEYHHHHLLPPLGLGSQSEDICSGSA